MLPGPMPAVVYGDAAGCGHMGVVLWADRVCYTFSSHAPEWMADAKCRNGILELTAAVTSENGYRKGLGRLIALCFPRAKGCITVKRGPSISVFGVAVAAEMFPGRMVLL